LADFSRHPKKQANTKPGRKLRLFSLLGLVEEVASIAASKQEAARPLETIN
jgi:hypothetical protein